MTEQLSLELVQPLRYSSSAFFVHTGVEDAVRTVTTLSGKRNFSITYIRGEKCSGKTHLGVYLVGRHQERNGRARLISGSSLVSWFSEELPGTPIHPWELVVIDDADLCLGEGMCQGILVDLIERISRQKGSLVLIGGADPEAIPTSPQLRSRLNAGLYLAVGGPKETELDPLLDLITKQRGLQLSESKRAYVLKRVERTIPALVNCVERVEDSSFLGDASTSFHKLSDALTVESSES
jgi:chromosomal replication initiation ATPase DnaA